MIIKGVPEDAIFVTGIPIRNKFLNRIDQNTLRSQLGYPPDDKIILIMGGGLGLLPTEDEFYRWLIAQEKVQVVVLTSKNKKLYQRLKSMNAPNMRVYGFCEQVIEYMKIGDVLIGKSGGITLYEAIASNLPMIVFQPKLGQEIENSRFIVNKGIGYIANNYQELKSTISLMLDEQRQEKIKANLQVAQKAINTDLLTQKIMEYCSINPKRPS